MRVDLFDYELPPELIAERPTDERDGARLLVLDADGTPPRHAAVRELERELLPGSLLVVNDTRVVPARLLGRKVDTGGRTELLLLRRLGVEAIEHDGRSVLAERWEALGKASKGLRPGTLVAFGEGGSDLVARIERRRESSAHGGQMEVLLSSPSGVPIGDAIEAVGHVPLPPYIRRADEPLDRERYQTVFARVPGAVAAPTAGLHLSPALLDRLRGRGIETATVTLHVGLGTFQPVTEGDLDQHAMHAEAFSVPQSTAAAIERARGRGAPVVAVGTTVVRTLESAADPERLGCVREAAGETRLLIQPGYAFRVVDELLTNFHLPRSTLLALVSAFAGRERVLEAYRSAIEARYRFYSYGDAMLARRRLASS